MKERHWQTITDKVGFKVEPSEDLTFPKLLDMDLMKYIDLCCEVGERAAKEFHIETELAKMKAMWDEINFDLVPYKNNLTYIIRG